MAMKKYVLLFLILCFQIVPALGWIHGNPLPPAQIFLNLGASNGDGTGFDSPFIDYMHLWLPSYLNPSTSVITSDGYPQDGILAANIQGAITLPPEQTTGSTTWVISWSGTAGSSGAVGLTIGVPTSVVSGGSCVKGVTTTQMFLFGTNCEVHFTFTTTPSSTNFEMFAAATFTGFSNLHLYRLSDQTAFNGGEIFNPDFITKIKSLRPTGIRVINYTQVNGNNNMASLVGDLTIPTTAVSWAVWWNPAIWGGVASGGTTDYSVSNGTTLTSCAATEPNNSDGYTIQVQFPSNSTANPTFSVDGGTTKIGIYELSGTNTQAVSINGNYTLRYDCLLNKWLLHGSTTRSGIPISALVALANELGTGLYFNVPTYATDALVTSLVTYIKNNLVGTAFYEYSLEVWNDAFVQSLWARNRGAALGFPTAGIGVDQQEYDYYALRVRQIMANVATIYGASTNYSRILANFALAPAISQTYRLNGTDLNVTSNSTLCVYLGGTYSAGACSGGVSATPYNTFPNRPVDLSDAIAWADYYNGAQTPPFDGNYTTTQSGKNVTAATRANPMSVTIASHGYSTGQHVTVGGFTGNWTGANIGGATVTVTDANNFTVPVDSSGFVSAYSSNGGTVARFSDELNGLLAAADAYASSGAVANACNGLTTPVAWMDCDVNAGTNYGVLAGGTLSYLNTNVNAPWDTVVASYDGARPIGKANLISVWYEGGLQLIYPSSASCTTLGISGTYCGASGKIANLIGVGTGAASTSYKMSGAFSATAKLAFDQFFAQSSHSKYASKYVTAGADEWSLWTGTIYSPVFNDYSVIQGYHYP